MLGKLAASLLVWPNMNMGSAWYSSYTDLADVDYLRSLMVMTLRCSQPKFTPKLFLGVELACKAYNATGHGILSFFLVFVFVNLLWVK